ncbi:MAG: hypothetical protein A2W31_09385 [Planctomycetes bacterium RBG_16_64_10]|nr:MAG: hypothetical protein A2W31_09385 [Planctomycetes bacterium RBG_16_64_10]
MAGLGLRVYTPAITIWVFLSQCLSADDSCRDAVARLIAWRVAQGQRPCSADTGAYCTARGNLPEEAIHQLVRETGMEADDLADEDWLWQGRRVRVTDGSTITMPDTPANQAEYPQQENQKPGCGFPIALGDMNDDDAVNGLDVNPFIASVISGGLEHMVQEQLT